MIRTVLIQGGVVAAAHVSEAPLTEAERRAWLLGPDAAPDAPLPPGDLVELTGEAAPPPIGSGWTYAEGQFSPPPPPPRMISSEEFVGCFTAAETAALLDIPELAQAALLAASQGSINLDSPRTAALMALAVHRGALTPARAAAVLRGEPAPA
jgi:hypothetical protein